MIQRIQSVYLAVAGLIGFVGLPFKIGQTKNYSIKAFNIKYIGDGVQKDMMNWPLEFIVDDLYPSILITIGLICFTAIALFKFRKHQLFLCKVLFLLLIVNISFLFYLFLSEEIIYWGVSAFIPILQLAIVLLSLRAIKKDEELVRSVDRIR